MYDLSNVNGVVAQTLMRVLDKRNTYKERANALINGFIWDELEPGGDYWHALYTRLNCGEELLEADYKRLQGMIPTETFGQTVEEVL